MGGVACHGVWRRCDCGGWRCSGRAGVVGPVGRAGRGWPWRSGWRVVWPPHACTKVPAHVSGGARPPQWRTPRPLWPQLAAVGRYKSHGLGRLLLCLRVRSGAKPAILRAIHPVVSAHPAHQASGGGLTPGSGGGHTWRRVQAPKSPQRAARTWPRQGGPRPGLCLRQLRSRDHGSKRRVRIRRLPGLRASPAAPGRRR